MSWFQCKVTYDKEVEQGMMRRVHEYYLVDAGDFTDAEERMVREMSSLGLVRLDIVKKVVFSETFFNNGSLFFKAKVGFVQLDEKNGVEKKKYSNILIQANSFRDAFDELENQMKPTLYDWTLVSLQETPIVDVFR